MHPMLNIGIRAARAAGDHTLKYLDRVHDLPVSRKGRNDFVSEVDRQAETIIIDTIRKAYPNHGILAEESGTRGADEYQWIVDPLDGTTNYLHGFPHYAVSIALSHKGVLDQAVIYDPLRGELFTASRGGGAYLDNRRIRVSKTATLDGALLGTGFPFRDDTCLDAFLDCFRAIFPMTAGIRRAGAASLDLAYVACGRLDGFWEFGLKPWDMAAGVLLITESGGMAGDPAGAGGFLESGRIVTGNPAVYRLMLDIFSPAVRQLPEIHAPGD